MIILIFITLLAFSLVLLFVGKALDAPPVQLSAYMFLFLLGITLMLGGVSFKSGESYSYVCACCDVSRGYTTTCETGSALTLSNVTDVYTNYSGEIVIGIMLHHVFGLFIAMLAAFGFIIVLINLKSPSAEDAFNDYRNP